MTHAKVEHLSSVELLPAYKTLGVSPGDLIDVIQAEVDRTLEEAKGDRRKAVNLGLQRMRANGLITNADLQRLEKACLIIFSVDAGKRSQPDAAAELDALYLDAVRDPESSSMGATMIGVMYSARNRQTAAAAGLMGMLVGGLLTGGPGGALIGGLIGWTLGGGCKKD